MSFYRDKFAQRMAMAGIKPHHRVAVGVSGGPDSVALCVLTAGWKSGSFFTSTSARSNFVDGVLAIVVDHGLRKESAEEAILVSGRIMDMGIKCEVAQCEWLEGKPKVGHLQEAARNKRYEILQKICLRENISVLLIAHHADDQAELFILRLSRNSGVFGLAGMAFVAEMFPEYPNLNGEESETHGVFLVRPLLEFSKEDLYNICRGGCQEWVEDPTNRSPLFARNRIRFSLNKFSSSAMAELREMILICCEMRMHVEKNCHMLLHQTVTIMPYGYAVVDVEHLLSMEIKDIDLARFIAIVLQKHRPVRGKALKLLFSYFRSYPCKTCLTVAGCYLCPAPESKGTKVLVCCSVDSPLPPTLKLFHPDSYRMHFDMVESEQIVSESNAHLDRHSPRASNVRFVNAVLPTSVLEESKKLGIISLSTYQTIVSLKREESENFKSKAESISDDASKDVMDPYGLVPNGSFYPGQIGYFMNRVVLHWMLPKAESTDAFCKDVDSVSSKSSDSRHSCTCEDHMAARVRHMIDADWIHVFDLAKEDATDLEPRSEIDKRTNKYAVLSARRALPSLKSIPAPARRAMPVLVNTEGVLLSIPGVGFSCCPCLMVTEVFKPRVPLGGGHSSFL